jgi:hypothetical protein
VSDLALLLVGSARPSGASTSEALGAYLMEQLAERGLTTATRFVSRSARRDHIGPLLHDLDQASLLILTSPLYVDALPYLVTRALERIADHRQRPGHHHDTRFAALLNCGFPEAHQCDTARGICRSFARHARFHWAGALCLGGGGAINGRPLDEAGFMARHARAALDMAADALAAGEEIPEEAVARMARPLLPGRLYTTIAELDWLRQARRNGVLTRLGDRPLA